MFSSEFVCIDGRTYPEYRDPPVQPNAYIAPGDERQETYRLFTFRQLPNGCPVAPAKFAAAGFYYTGSRDRVKCFSCGLYVENWIVGDDPSDKRWHKSDCGFANVNVIDTTNQPIRGFTRFLNLSPQRNPSSNGGNYIAENSQNTNSQVVISGENFVQETMGVEFRDGAPETVSNRTQLPLRHSPFEEPRSSPTSAARTGELLYPCNNPVNPHFSSAVMRLESFKPRNGVRWIRERLRGRIADLVNAGFYFLGEGDRVKCWYCNGELSDWNYEVDPFTEHAKWFPSCEYVLRIKGPIFVENTVVKYPNLRRPILTIVRPPFQRQPPSEPSPIFPPLTEQQSSQQCTPVSLPRTPFRPPHTTPPPTPTTLGLSYKHNPPPRPSPISPPRPPQSSPHGSSVSSPFRTTTPSLTVNEAVGQAMTNFEYVGNAKDMGFEDDLIKEVLKRKYEANAQFHTAAEEFLEALFAAQSCEENVQQSQTSSEREIAPAAGEQQGSPQLTSVSFSCTPFPARPTTPPFTVYELQLAITDHDYIKSAKDMGFEDDLIRKVLKRKYEINAQFYTTVEEFVEALLKAQGRHDNIQQ